MLVLKKFYTYEVLWSQLCNQLYSMNSFHKMRHKYVISHIVRSGILRDKADI